MDIKLLNQLFPEELIKYFTIFHFETLYNIKNKKEFFIIKFKEKNKLPDGYLSPYYESKKFMESNLIAVFIKIKK